MAAHVPWAALTVSLAAAAAALPGVRGRGAGAAEPIGSGISWQAHSYDDLREWPQLFTKAAAYVKIDPQWAPQSFCASQTRANASDPRGCLLLNHDPLWPGRTDYNTTGECEGRRGRAGARHTV
jgi:hypothetical protein